MSVALDLLHHEALAQHDDRPCRRAAASVESHMFAWYAEVVPPEKYMPTVGWYSVQPACRATPEHLASSGARLPGSSQVHARRRWPASR